jgi:pimeloyl-ACP methyl ester carboxylesterase
MKRFLIGKCRWIFFGCVSLALGFAAISFQSDIPAGQAKNKYATASSKFIHIDNMTVHYRDEGVGPALLLIHGSNCSLHAWEGWQGELRQKFRVISVDLPGHGLTGPNPNGKYDYFTMVNFLNRLVDMLQIDTFSVAGNSMGGAIALNYAILHPSRVENLILIDSLGYADEIPPLVLRMWGYPLVGQMMTVFTPRFVYAQTIRSIYGHKERVNDHLIDRYYELLLRDGNRDATRLRFTEPVWDIEPSRIRSIKIPTLIMWGGKDPWFGVEYGRRFADEISGASLRIYSDLGHVPMEEAPEETARDAAAFLTQGRL